MLVSTGILGREYVPRCPGWIGCGLGSRLGVTRSTISSSVGRIPTTSRRTRITWIGTLVGRGFAASGSWSTHHDTRLRRPTRTLPSRTPLSISRYVLSLINIYLARFMFPTCSLLVQTDLHREILEVATTVQQRTQGDTRGLVQRIIDAARRGIRIATCRTPRDSVDRPVRG